MERYNATLTVKFSRNFDMNNLNKKKSKFGNFFRYKLDSDTFIKLFDNGNCIMLVANCSMDSTDFSINCFRDYLRKRINDNDIHVVDQKLCFINCVTSTIDILDVNDAANKLIENGFQDKNGNLLTYIYNGVKGEVYLTKNHVSISGKFPYFNLFTQFKNYVKNILEI